MENPKKQMAKSADEKIRIAEAEAKNTDPLDGMKTYIVAAVAAALAVMAALGVDVPPLVWEITGVLGLGALRMAHKKAEKSADAARKSVKAVSQKLDATGLLD